MDVCVCCHGNHENVTAKPGDRWCQQCQMDGCPQPKLEKDAVSAVIVPLPFKVFLKTLDGEWTLKAAFATGRIAGAWVIGLTSSNQNLEAKIMEDRQGELFEVTQEAVKSAMEAINTAMNG